MRQKYFYSEIVIYGVIALKNIENFYFLRTNCIHNERFRNKKIYAACLIRNKIINIKQTLSFLHFLKKKNEINIAGDSRSTVRVYYLQKIPHLF
jgi:hypothetical protein